MTWCAWMGGQESGGGGAVIGSIGGWVSVKALSDLGGETTESKSAASSWQQWRMTWRPPVYYTARYCWRLAFLS